MTWKGWEDFAGKLPQSAMPRQPMRPKAKRSKYGAVPTVVDGIRFDSKKEANYYLRLKLSEKIGDIRGLTLQKEWPLVVVADVRSDDEPFYTRIGTYRSDFDYFDVVLNARVVVDVKGIDTPLSKWKRKHVAAQYGIEVQIV